MMEGEINGRTEAQRCLVIAEKLLTARDLVGSQNFAARAQQHDPFLDGVDQILAVVEVLLAAEKRINNHFDWYAILQLDRQSNDLELIKKKYKRLALLLHPDKNKAAFADNAFKLIVDAWAVLSNPSKKTLYDNELSLFSKLVSSQQQQSAKVNTREKKRKASREQNFNSSSSGISSLMSTFWTTCPYCYNLYEYPRVYEDCCLRCEKCKRAFQAVMVKSVPQSLPGKEEFYCCWGLFPLAYSTSNSDGGKPKFPGFPTWMSSAPMVPPPPSAGKNTEIPKWMPFSPMFTSQPQGEGNPSATAAGQVNFDNDSDDDCNIVEAGNLSTQAEKRTLSNKKTEEMRTVVPAVTVAKPQMRKKTVAKRTQKQKGRGPQDKKEGSRSEMPDLNGDLGYEAKDSEPTTGEGMDALSGDEDVATGSCFFEGLDEFLGNLPILNAVNEGAKVGGGA